MCLPVKPYKVEREWEHAGLKCAVVLAREAGHRCGYVRVPLGHPFHGKGYSDLDVNVHGGLTFARLEDCKHEDGQGHWFGFDCAHCDDESHDPNIQPEDVVDAEARAVLEIHRECEAKYPHPYGLALHYWTQLEVERETERLAEQLAAMTVEAA